jgi:hypothetical protein
VNGVHFSGSASPLPLAIGFARALRMAVAALVGFIEE